MTTCFNDDKALAGFDYKSIVTLFLELFSGQVENLETPKKNFWVF